MKTHIKKGNITELKTDVLVVNLFEGVTKLSGTIGAVDKSLDGLISKYIIAKDKFNGAFGKMQLFNTFGKAPFGKVLMVGLGKKEDFSVVKIRVLGSMVMQQLKTYDSIKTINSILFGAGAAGLCAQECAQALIEGATIGAYEFDKYKSDKKKKVEQEFAIIEQDEKIFKQAKIGFEKGLIVSKAMNLAKDMANEPAQFMTPPKVAEIAQTLEGIEVKIYEKADVEKFGMGAFLGVAQGSDIPLKFIHMKYSPKNPTKKVAVIGKSVTFDSGGLDLKPPSSMLNMKDDMAGSACVMGVMSVISQLKPKFEVNALIASCENMPSGRAYKPGDVLTAMNGKTIEVDNTDAEGRLTLADAICFAQEKLKVDEIVDVATLTGACMVALGSCAFGVMGNNQDFIDVIKDSATKTGEYIWQLPMLDEYAKSLKSDIADMKNTGSRYGGASVAGKFLEKFVHKSVKWAHIDIAGTAMIDKNIYEYTKGATASSVRTLINWLTR